MMQTIDVLYIYIYIYSSVCFSYFLSYIDMYGSNIKDPIIRSYKEIRSLPTNFISTMKRIFEIPFVPMHDTRFLLFHKVHFEIYRFVK